VYQAPRGTQDVLPEDQPYLATIEAAIRRMAGLYGYRRMDTPIFEATSLFVRGVGEGTDIVDKEMYTVEDKGVDSLTLRPEYTACIMRGYLEHGMNTRQQPVKVYTIGPIFRYERPQAGRFRQHTQVDVEAIGESDPALDVEIMSFAAQLYSELGFTGLSFQVNSIGCPVCRPGYVHSLVQYYQQHREAVCPDCRRRLARNPLRLLDCKEERCQPVIEAAPRVEHDLCPECSRHFALVLNYLDRLGRPYVLNHRLVRGLDYYTRTVFEVWAQGIGAQNALGGGGRYDGLAQAIGGPHTPAVGFASGIERAVLLMREQELAVAATPEPPLLVATQGDEAKAAGVSLVNAWRGRGVGAGLSFGERSLRAQLRQANRAGSRYVVIIGPEEMAAGVAAVRDMASGEQETLPLAVVVEALSARVQPTQERDG